ncbi:MAG: hypothetical protein SGJ04_04490 [Bacteroidota bacterium]|nr:hypothetical protein [Bacteroidota bacterium]
MNKIWLFPSVRKLTGTEEIIIKRDITQFLDSWAAHGAQLTAKVDILHNMIIKVSANEEMVIASGCSIDKMTKFISAISDNYHLDLFNRERIYIIDNQDKIQFFKLSELNKKVKADNALLQYNVLNNSVVSDLEFEQNWSLPLKESAYSRMLT